MTIVLPRDPKPEIIEFFKKYGVEFDYLVSKIEHIASTIKEKAIRCWTRTSSEAAIYRRLLKYNLKKALIVMKRGFLIEAGSAEQLSAAILKLYTNEKMRNNLAQNGRAFVLENVDERIAGRIVIENYEKCLAN